MNKIIKSFYNETDDQFPALMSPRILTDFLTSIAESRSDMFDIRAEYPYNIFAETDEHDNAKKYVIEFALAGFKKEDINVRVEHDKLAISVETNVKTEGPKLKENETEVPKEAVSNLKTLHKGIARRSMKTFFNLGGGIDKKKISTKFEDGMLTIEVPVKEEDSFDIGIN